MKTMQHYTRNNTSPELVDERCYSGVSSVSVIKRHVIENIEQIIQISSKLNFYMDLQTNEFVVYNIVMCTDSEVSPWSVFS